MKKTIVYLILFLFFLTSGPCAFAYGGGCSAASAILYQPDTDTVLYEINADAPCLIASTTKILTALVVLENCDSEGIVEIHPEYTGIEGSSMYLRAGERFTVKELLYGMLLESGNDAAHALACYTADSVEGFAVMMNEKAAELGCTGSHFSNPHGLDADRHYATARDLAIIMTASMKNPVFAEISGTKSIQLGGRTITNHNKLLWSCRGVNGGKTGYTESAGRTLVSSCNRDGMQLICVTISDRNDWADHTAMYEWAYGEYSLINTDSEYNVQVVSGEQEYVKVSGNIKPALIKNGDSYSVRVMLPGFVYAPVIQGECAGSIVVSYEGGSIETTELTYNSTVLVDEAVPLNMWEQVKWSWYYYNRHSGVVPALPYI